MEVLFIMLAVLAVGAAVVYFLNSPWGIQVVHQQSKATILNSVSAQQRAAPQTPLAEIYYALAEERHHKSKWLSEYEYLHRLRDAGCFDVRTAPPPEEFAELMANLEEQIRLRASGVTK
jgi:hypothetical protein